MMVGLGTQKDCEFLCTDRALILTLATTTKTI